MIINYCHKKDEHLERIIYKNKEVIVLTLPGSSFPEYVAQSQKEAFLRELGKDPKESIMLNANYRVILGYYKGSREKENKLLYPFYQPRKNDQSRVSFFEPITERKERRELMDRIRKTAEDLVFMW